MDLQVEEKLKFDVGANLKRGLEYVGGKLVITNERLHFKPHILTIQKRELQLPIKEIEAVKKTTTLFIIPNSFKIKCKDGSSYKFVVYKKEEIINYIQGLIEKK